MYVQYSFCGTYIVVHLYTTVEPRLSGLVGTSGKKSG